MLRGWDDAVVGWTEVGDYKFVVYDIDRAVVMWERRGMSHEQATHIVAIAQHARKGRRRRIWVHPASASDLREMAEKRREARQRRDL